MVLRRKEEYREMNEGELFVRAQIAFRNLQYNDTEAYMQSRRTKTR